MADGMTQMRVGIATFMNEINYGALLQAYALGAYIRSLGYSVCYINDAPAKHTAPRHPVKKLFYYLIAKNRIQNKQKVFSAFKDQHLQVIDRADQVDILVCGSDQIWNVNITGGFHPLFFGELTEKNIAYAASCGDVGVLEKDTETFGKLLGNFCAVSSREKDLAAFVEKISGKQCPVVCDPTFLLSPKAYGQIETPERLVKDDYLLIYQMNKASYLYTVAKEIARKKHLKIVEINNNMYDYTVRGHKRFYAGTIGDFLSLFRHASFVVTNSFHGTAFSLIYQKEFYVIKSKARNSRIVDLCGIAGLQDRVLENNQNIADLGDTSVSYAQVQENLMPLMEASRQYLQTAL